MQAEGFRFQAPCFHTVKRGLFVYIKINSNEREVGYNLFFFYSGVEGDINNGKSRTLAMIVFSSSVDIGFPMQPFYN
jgi:hypothetical protein